MTISRIAHLAEPALTNQQLADLALTAWQSARRAAQHSKTLTAFTPVKYEGSYPPYFNVSLSQEPRS